ncbi:MAG: thioredoxin [Sphaerochaetaceae bacterium]|jgi:thioredoxin 1
MSEVTLTTANFEAEVLKSDLPVLVDFWAEWCGPCKMIAPSLVKLAEKYDGKLKVGKLNVDEQLQLAEQYRIASIPTLAVFKGGEVVGQRIGALSLPMLESFVAEFI